MVAESSTASDTTFAESLPDATIARLPVSYSSLGLWLASFAAATVPSDHRHCARQPARRARRRARPTAHRSIVSGQPIQTCARNAVARDLDCDQAPAVVSSAFSTPRPTSQRELRAACRRCTGDTASERAATRDSPRPATAPPSGRCAT